MTEKKKKSKSVERVLNIRKSGASGTHADRRLKRLKTRQNVETQAKEEYDER